MKTKFIFLGLALIGNLAAAKPTPVPYPYEATEIINLLGRCPAEFEEIGHGSNIFFELNVSKETVQGDENTYYEIRAVHHGYLPPPMQPAIPMATFTITETQLSQEHRSPAPDANGNPVTCGPVNKLVK